MMILMMMMPCVTMYKNLDRKTAENICDTRKCVQSLVIKQANMRQDIC